MLRLTINAYRKRMHRLAEQYGIGDLRVLRMSQRLDRLIVRAMVAEQGGVSEGRS
jgi:hypothetical protein